MVNVSGLLTRNHFPNDAVLKVFSTINPDTRVSRRPIFIPGRRTVDCLALRVAVSLSFYIE